MIKGFRYVCKIVKSAPIREKMVQNTHKEIEHFIVYKCPFKECSLFYDSILGIKRHIAIYDHKVFFSDKKCYKCPQHGCGFSVSCRRSNDLLIHIEQSHHERNIPLMKEVTRKVMKSIRTETILIDNTLLQSRPISETKRVKKSQYQKNSKNKVQQLKNETVLMDIRSQVNIEAKPMDAHTQSNVETENIDTCTQSNMEIPNIDTYTQSIMEINNIDTRNQSNEENLRCETTIQNDAIGNKRIDTEPCHIGTKNKEFSSAMITENVDKIDAQAKKYKRTKKVANLKNKTSNDRSRKSISQCENPISNKRLSHENTQKSMTRRTKASRVSERRIHEEKRFQLVEDNAELGVYYRGQISNVKRTQLNRSENDSTEKMPDEDSLFLTEREKIRKSIEIIFKDDPDVIFISFSMLKNKESIIYRILNFAFTNSTIRINDLDKPKLFFCGIPGCGKHFKSIMAYKYHCNTFLHSFFSLYDSFCRQTCIEIEYESILEDFRRFFNISKKFVLIDIAHHSVFTPDQCFPIIFSTNKDFIMKNKSTRKRAMNIIEYSTILTDDFSITEMSDQIESLPSKITFRGHKYLSTASNDVATINKGLCLRQKSLKNDGEAPGSDISSATSRDSTSVQQEKLVDEKEIAEKSDPSKMYGLVTETMDPSQIENTMKKKESDTISEIEEKEDLLKIEDTDNIKCPIKDENSGILTMLNNIDSFKRGAVEQLHQEDPQLVDNMKSQEWPTVYHDAVRTSKSFAKTRSHSNPPNELKKTQKSNPFHFLNIKQEISASSRQKNIFCVCTREFSTREKRVFDFYSEKSTIIFFDIKKELKRFIFHFGYVRNIKTISIDGPLVYFCLFNDGHLRYYENDTLLLRFDSKNITSFTLLNEYKTEEAVLCNSFQLFKYKLGRVIGTSTTFKSPILGIETRSSLNSTNPHKGNTADEKIKDPFHLTPKSEKDKSKSKYHSSNHIPTVRNSVSQHSEDIFDNKGNTIGLSNVSERNKNIHRDTDTFLDFYNEIFLLDANGKIFFCDSVFRNEQEIYTNVGTTSFFYLKDLDAFLLCDSFLGNTKIMYLHGTNRKVTMLHSNYISCVENNNKSLITGSFDGQIHSNKILNQKKILPEQLFKLVRKKDHFLLCCSNTQPNYKTNDTDLASSITIIFVYHINKHFVFGLQSGLILFVES